MPVRRDEFQRSSVGESLVATVRTNTARALFRALGCERPQRSSGSGERASRRRDTRYYPSLRREVRCERNGAAEAERAVPATRRQVRDDARPSAMLVGFDGLFGFVSCSNTRRRDELVHLRITDAMAQVGPRELDIFRCRRRRTRRALRDCALPSPERRRRASSREFPHFG